MATELPRLLVFAAPLYLILNQWCIEGWERNPEAGAWGPASATPYGPSGTAALRWFVTCS